MLYQVASDIHLEKRSIPTLLKKAECLILAGDIGSPLLPSYREFLYQCSHQFSKTFVIAGNHEYWDSSIPETHRIISGIASSFRNITYLNDSCSHIGEKVIFGATFWTHVKRTDLKSSDYLRIKGFCPHTRNKLNIITSNLIVKYRPDIVVTHHPPVRDVVPEKFRHLSLDHWANDAPHLLRIPERWVCGHLHSYVRHSKVEMNPLFVRVHKSADNG